MCCASEVFMQLCHAYSHSWAIVQKDAIERNKSLIKIRNEGKHLKKKSREMESTFKLKKTLRSSVNDNDRVA